jgi:hypothetical protein
LVDAETARQALIDAAQRAGLLAHKWEVDGQPVTTTYVRVPAMEAISEAHP